MVCYFSVCFLDGCSCSCFCSLLIVDCWLWWLLLLLLLLIVDCCACVVFVHVSRGEWCLDGCVEFVCFNEFLNLLENIV